MGRLTILLLLLVAPVVGCSAPTPIERWVVAQGGTVCDQRLERARPLVAALCDSRHDVKLEVAVLDRDDLAAFSWPDGHIFLSRGLIDSLDDAALSAAIAHEIAHVLNHKHSNGVAALRGSDARLTEEVRADRLGVHLLQAAGVSGDAMAAMLECVLHAGDLPPQVQAELRHRAKLLRSSTQVD
jgi:predicted Zn-dependent protease